MAGVFCHSPQSLTDPSSGSALNMNSLSHRSFHQHAKPSFRRAEPFGEVMQSVCRFVPKVVVTSEKVYYLQLV